MKKFSKNKSLNKNILAMILALAGVLSLILVFPTTYSGKIFEGALLFSLALLLIGAAVIIRSQIRE